MYVYLRAKFEVSKIILMSFRLRVGGGGGGGGGGEGNFNPKAYDNKEFSHENWKSRRESRIATC